MPSSHGSAESSRKPDFYLYLSAYKNLEILGSMTRRVQKEEIMEALDDGRVDIARL